MDRKVISILILEKDMVAASSIESIIQECGVGTVGIAGDHQSAMQFCKTSRVDLVIAKTEIDGEPDGIETAFILQEIYNTRVIFIASSIDSEALTRAARINFMGYLLKPYRKDDLLVLIRLFIAKYHLVKHDMLKCCGYTYNTHLNKIYYNDQEIVLTPHEKLLFLLLFHERGSLVDHEKIDEVIWSDTYVSSETRRQLVHRLKMKLPHASIKIVRGQGYRLV
jgi:DNA-binding response OmpR family regulator